MFSDKLDQPAFCFRWSLICGFYYLEMFHLIIKDGDEFGTNSACGCFNFSFLSACKREPLAESSRGGFLCPSL